MSEFARPSGARISRVETIPLHVPFGTPFRIAGGPARPFAEILLVVLHTDMGIQGVGETQAWRRIGSNATLPSLVAEIDGVLTPHCLGRDPFDAPAILRDCDAALPGAWYAKAAVADALLDLEAHLLSVPAWRLLGAKCREAIPTCAVLPLADSADLTMESARACVAAGHRSATLKVGVDLAADVALALRLRGSLPELALRPDANASLDRHSAMRLVPALRDAGVVAIEQPLAPDDLEGMAELVRRFGLPLIADEAVRTTEDLLRVVATNAASGVQTKGAKNGGARRTRAIWDAASQKGVAIYPGNHPATSIGTASVLHLAAAWPGDLADGPFAVGIAGALARDIVTAPLRVVDGAVGLPDGPGFGVTLDRDAVAELRVVA